MSPSIEMPILTQSIRLATVDDNGKPDGDGVRVYLDDKFPRVALGEKLSKMMNPGKGCHVIRTDLPAGKNYWPRSDAGNMTIESARWWLRWGDAFGAIENANNADWKKFGEVVAAVEERDGDQVLYRENERLKIAFRKAIERTDAAEAKLARWEDVYTSSALPVTESERMWQAKELEETRRENLKLKEDVRVLTNNVNALERPKDVALAVKLEKAEAKIVGLERDLRESRMNYVQVAEAMGAVDSTKDAILHSVVIECAHGLSDDASRYSNMVIEQSKLKTVAEHERDSLLKEVERLRKQPKEKSDHSGCRRELERVREGRNTDLRRERDSLRGLLDKAYEDLRKARCSP